MTFKKKNMHEIKWNSRTYEFVQVAGKGSYGKVLVFKDKEEDGSPRTHIALKIIKNHTKFTGLCTSAVREVCILNMLHHPCIVQILDVWYNEADTTLVLEYLPINLLQHLRKLQKLNRTLNNNIVQNYSRQLLQAIRYCHSKGVLHRDLKPANLLLSSGNYLKLADFGMAHLQTNLAKMSCGVVTLWYRAPELLVAAEGGTHAYDEKIDVWSVGCILVEMITGKPPFTGKTRKEVWHQIQAFKDGVLKNYPNKLFVNLIHCLLKKDPNKRASTLDALTHAYFCTKP